MPRVQQKRGTASALASVNPTPAAGELIVVSDENSLKIGNGIDAYTSLAYVTATPRSHTHTLAQITDLNISPAGSPPSPYDVALSYNYSSATWSTKTIGNVGVGSQPIGGWPAGSLGSSLAGKASTTHASAHATGGSDALTPSDIGAAPAASPTFTGDVTIPDKIVHAGNNSAIRFPADDTVTIETAGVERLRVDSAGRVGIGQSSPQYDLHVRNLSATSTTVGANIIGRLQSNASGGDVNLQFSDGVANASQIGMQSGGVYVITAGSERFRINSAGNVGIGTNTPSSLLHVNGVITVSAGSGSAGSYLPSVVFSGDPNTGIQQIGGADTWSAVTGGVERMRIRGGTDGNISIGGTGASNVGFYHQYTLSASSVTRYAEVIAPTISSASTTNVSLVTTSPTLQQDATTASFIHFQVGAPTLNAGASITNHYGVFVPSTFTAGSANYGILSGIPSGTDRWNIHASGTAQNYFAGNVGIGASRTVPSSALDVNGVITVAAGSAAAPALVSGTGTSDSGLFWPAADTVAISTAGAERVRVGSTGNVGLNGAATLHGNLTIRTTSAGSTATPIYNGIAWGYSGDQSINLGSIDYVSRFSSVSGGAMRFRLYTFSGGASIDALTLDNQSKEATFTIPVIIPAGSGSAGSYVAGLAFASDANTGIAQIGGADTWSVVCGGTERVRVKATGAVRFVPLAADPASGNEAGDVYYNSANNKLRVYNGTSWVDLH